MTTTIQKSLRERATEQAAQAKQRRDRNYKENCEENCQRAKSQLRDYAGQVLGKEFVDGITDDQITFSDVSDDHAIASITIDGLEFYGRSDAGALYMICLPDCGHRVHVRVSDLEDIGNQLEYHKENACPSCRKKKQEQPQPPKINEGGPIVAPHPESAYEGMTLRQHYAGLAMLGLIQVEAQMWNEKGAGGEFSADLGHQDHLSKLAVQQADALIAELNK